MLDETEQVRIRVRVLPDWIPQLTIEAHDPGLSMGGWLIYGAEWLAPERVPARGRPFD